MEQLTAHLMPIFLTPHSALRLAGKDSGDGHGKPIRLSEGKHGAGALDEQKRVCDTAQSLARRLGIILERCTKLEKGGEILGCSEGL
jgi:hypothetical protein